MLPKSTFPRLNRLPLPPLLTTSTDIQHTMIDHIGIYVADYAAAKKFYEPVLASIGAKMISEPAPVVSGWGREHPTFWIAAFADGKKPAEPEMVHVAFSCESRDQVDAFYEAAIKAGAKDNGKPGLREQYHPNYYGAFVIDADGNNIEAVCHH